MTYLKDQIHLFCFELYKNQKKAIMKEFWNQIVPN